MRRIRLFAAVSAIALVAAACGDAADDTTTTTAAAVAPTADIVETAIAAGDFTTLVAAVEAADLVETLQGEGPFTVFAPTDEAFVALPEGTLDSLLADPDALSNVLLYHVVPGEVTADQVVELSTATTVQGADLSIEVTDGNVTVNGANVVTTDVMASNGVIHVIDAVLVP